MFSGLKIKHLIFIFILISLIMTIAIKFAYLFNYYTNTRDKSVRYFNGIAGQIDKTAEKMFDEIENVAFMMVSSYNIQYILHQESSESKFAQMNFVYDNMQYCTRINSDILSILLLGRNNVRLVENDNNIKNDIYYNIDRDYGYSNLKDVKNYFTKSYVEPGSDIVYFGYIVPIYSVLSGEVSEEVIGSSVMICSTGNIAKLLKNIEVDPDTLFYISDGSRVIASNTEIENGVILDNQLQKIMNDGLKNKIVFYKGTNYLVNVSDINIIGWKIVSLMPQTALTRDMADVMVFGIIVMVLSLIIYMLIGIAVFRSVTVPIDSMVSEMKFIGERDIKYRLRISSSNEVGIIAYSINLMLDKIEDMTRRIFDTQNKLYEVEISKKQAELMFYQSQINPHFLYNTLECIRSMTRKYNATDISTIVKSMAKIFRYAVKKENIVSIGTELECIQDYMNIMTIRYMNKYSLKTKVPDSVLNIPIIKMILQPIIENAVQHGMEGMKKKGVISVQCRILDTGDIRIDIADNGRGITEERVEQLNSLFQSCIKEESEYTERDNIGLYNIVRRLKLNYGNEYGLIVSSKYYYWSRITVLVPGKNKKA